MTNARIDDRYDLKELLGEGGMGIVYKAYDSQRKGYVALKTMKDVADPAALDLFAQEWRTLANLSHPNIVDVFNSGEFEEAGQRKPYFVMPLLPGRTLDKLIQDASHRLTVERVIDILIQACRGLQAAHDRGLIHRDLKPSNLFILNDDSVKIIDFGMVHLVDVRQSVTGIKGTLQYMAPEQLDMKDVSAATDIFSLGVVCYEALTGRKPFDRSNQGAIARAIRSEFPPPASDLNPTVNAMLAQVVAKATAKGPWNRFANAKEFGEHLQRALKGESIELFDLARIQPRVERARRALRESDLEFANEILNDLQLEGRVDPEITVLLEEVRRATHGKLIHQVLDTARMRLQEEEFPLAWQKVQEVLQLDPGNTEAQALQAEIDTRRSEQQVEKWRRLVSQHLHNQAFSQARQAVEEIRKIRHDDLEVKELAIEIGAREKEFSGACQEKETQYQSAMRAYGSGEISSALSKLEKILELDSGAPRFIVPGRDEVYRETYNTIRSEWEAAQHAVAEIERVMASGNLARAAEISKEQSTKYPNDFGLQALKLKVEDLLREEKSAYIAEIGRRVDAESDLNRAVRLLEEALERYPKEPHFQELASSLRKRRDLVESIAVKARQYEEQNLPSEALGQWKTLRGIYPQYHGLEFEIQRVQKRFEQQKREEAKLKWVDQIDRLLQTSEYDRAHDLVIQALSEFPGDQELQALKRLALDGRERSGEAIILMEKAQGLRSDQRIPESIEMLRRAADLDPNSSAIRSALADALTGQAQVLLATDWRAAEPLIQEALRMAPAHVLARSLRPSVLLAKRTEFIDQCIGQARELQASGDINGALDKLREGLASYPNDGRLLQFQSTLRSTTGERAHWRRSRDLDELKQVSQEVDEAHDQTSLTALLDRSVILSQLYPEDQEFSAVVSEIHERARKRPTPAAESPALKEPAEAVPPALKEPTQATPPALEAPVSARKAEPKVTVIDRWMRSAKHLLELLEQHVWKPLRGHASSLRLKTDSLLRQAQWKPLLNRFDSRLSRLPWIAWAGLAAVALIVAAILVIRSHNQHLPPPPSVTAQVAITFEANVQDTQILVDGQPQAGRTANLKPGKYSVRATKVGYRPYEREITVAGKPLSVPLKLEPESQVIRVLADLPGVKVVLDSEEIPAAPDGSFSHDLAAGGPHTLKLLQRARDVFSIEFQTQPGEPARLLAPLSSRDVPVAVLSTLGARARVHSSTPDMMAKLGTGDSRNIPPEGLEFSLLPTDNEVTFDDGKNPMSLPLESGNAPVLNVKVGVSNKSTLVIQANVEGARVWLNDVKHPNPIRRGKWMQQLDPGEYRIRLTSDGYDDTPEQKLTVGARKFISRTIELKATITTAYLRVQGGTPDAEVLVDGQSVGKLDADGSHALIEVTPDVEHSIRIQKEDYAPFETKSHAPAKGEIVISQAEARLKPFGALVFDIRPPDAHVTIQREGEAPRAAEKTMRLREGKYIVKGDADQYLPFRSEEQVVSGQSRTVRVVLLRRQQAVATPQQVQVDVPELFMDSKSWKRMDDGFWLHDSQGPGWFKDVQFVHVFEMLKPKKGLIKQDRIRWRIYLQGDDHIECELDDSAFYRKVMVDGHVTSQIKMPHKAGAGQWLRVEITVEQGRVLHKIGQATDDFPCKVEGRTGFTGKVGLRLVK